MSLTVPDWTDPPHRDHATIGEAGACAECRAWNIRVVEDAPHVFLLTFPALDGNGLHAIALVRNWAPDWSSAADTAWATGCNLPRGVFVEEIPSSVPAESGVDLFRLYEGSDAADALRRLKGAALAGGSTR